MNAKPNSITVRFSDEEYAAIEFAAQAMGGKSMGAAIREAVTVFESLGSISFMPIDHELYGDCRIIHTRKLIQIVKRNGSRWDLIEQLAGGEFTDKYLLIDGRWKPIAAFDVIPHDAVLFGSIKED